MDLQSAFVCVLVFVVSGAILLIVSMFGMREKSYEEALAEQRQLTGGLLASRPKSKDKKQKKTGKKVKEKSLSATGAQDSDEVESREEEPQAAPLAASKTHVEFEEPAIVVDAQTTINKVCVINNIIFCWQLTTFVFQQVLQIKNTTCVNVLFNNRYLIIID